jgi:hypothetical protein
MSDLDKIVLSGLCGVLFYAIGQLLSKFFIDPLYELRKTVGEVRFNLAFHTPTIHTPIGRTDENSKAAGEALLKNSSELVAKLHAVPCYTTLTRLVCALPCEKAVIKAAIELRGLSTYMSERGEKANASVEIIRERVAKIERFLRLKPLD